MNTEANLSRQRRYLYMLLALLAAITIIRLVYIGREDLFCDEAYYWNWSRHLDFGYVDHPPMVAYIIFFFTSIGGDSEFMVRIGSVLFTAGASLFVYLLGRNLFDDDKVGFFAALLLNLTPGFSLIGILATPDAPQIFFWALTLYLTHKALTTPRYWYLAGIALGLVLLCKYIAILLVPSVFLFLLLSPDHRSLLRRKEPYLALFIAFIIFVPVILWNAAHGWISFVYQLTHGVLEAQTTSFWGGLLEYAISQIQVLSPVTYIFCMMAILISGYRGIIKKNGPFLFLFCSSAPTILFFTLLNGMPHWAFPGYVGAVIALARLLQLFLRSPRFTALKAAIFFPACFILLCLPLLISATYVMNIRFDGWWELGKKVDEVMAGFPEPQETFIVGRDFPIPSEIAYYSNRDFQLYASVFDGYSQHSLWTDTDLMVGKDVLFVIEEDGEQDVFDLLSLLRESFDSVDMEVFNIKREGVIVKQFYIFKCLGFRGS